ncbi:MAG: hypothetical protein ACRDXB_12225 [Actinomycetes bacterium]
MLPQVSMVYSSAVPRADQVGRHLPEGVGFAANSGWRRHEEEPS